MPWLKALNCHSYFATNPYWLSTAFVKLGDRVSQVEKKPLRLNSASRWLDLSPEQRAATRVIEPTQTLCDEINEAVRARLTAEGGIRGMAWQSESSSRRAGPAKHQRRGLHSCRTFLWKVSPFRCRHHVHCRALPAALDPPFRQAIANPFSRRSPPLVRKPVTPPPAQA